MMIVFVILLTGSQRSTTKPFSTGATVAAVVVEDRVSRDSGITTSRATRNGEEGEDIVEDGDMVEEATVAVGTRGEEFVCCSLRYYIVLLFLFCRPEFCGFVDPYWDIAYYSCFVIQI